MNILLRHTVSSITRNPVQSVIVVVSTAMITACVLLCLCVSSLFEFTTRLWADYLYGGSQMIVSASPEHQAEVMEWLDAHDDVEAYIMTYNVSATVMTEDATVRAFGIANEFGTLDTYDTLISAVVLDRAENTTSLPSAHISADFAEVLGLSAGDTFAVKGNREFFVEAVCAATSRYYSNPLLAYAYETDGLPSVTADFSVWFTDAEAALKEGNATIAAYREELCAITHDKSSVSTAIASNLAEADASVEGSMRLMNIAASVISVVMACLLLASFSVIVRGRVNELIKFKAAGATPAQSALILIVEAALYAVVGGLIGLGIGEGLILYLNGTLPAGIEAAIVPSAGDYLAALAIGAACGLAACALPAARPDRALFVYAVTTLLPTRDFGSWRAYEKGWALSPRLMDYFIDRYCPDPAARYGASPLERLSGLPPTLLITAQDDILADQQTDLARRFGAEQRVYPGARHIFLSRPDGAPFRARALADIAAWLDKE